MKKYEKPSIEELNIGAAMPLMISSPAPDNLAPSKKDKNYDEEDFSEGW